MTSFTRILELSNDDDDEVRLRAIEALANFEVTSSLMRRVEAGLSDEDELVRVACAELAGLWDEAQGVPFLEKCLCDESYLVKAAALTSLGEIGGVSAIPLLKKYFSSLEGGERIAAAMALFNSGMVEYLEEVLLGFTDSDYRVRCRTANLLANAELSNQEDFVVSKLNIALTKEKTVAARSSAARSSISAAIEALSSL